MALNSNEPNCMPVAQEGHHLHVLFPTQVCIAYVVLVQQPVDAHHAGGAVW